MKLLFTILVLGFTQNLFASGTSLGQGAVVAANLVRDPVIQECLKKSEELNHASSSIVDVRVVDQATKQYEVEVFFHQGDVALGDVTLQVTSTVVRQPWGPVRVYSCTPAAVQGH